MPRKISTRVARIWNRFGQWYGSRWSETYGAVPPEDWVNTIERTNDERLELGMMDVRRASPVHPFTLGQLEAAIPKLRVTLDGPSPAEILTKAVTSKHQLCSHQFTRPWSFFGPVEEIAHKNTIVRSPIIKGVVVPECTECGKPSIRERLDDILGAGVAA